MIFRKKLLLLSCLMTMSLTSCRTVPKEFSGISALRPWITEGARPKTALVLSGGASRGFAHIGVLRIFEQEKIPIDMIVATSAGSLIGALYGSVKNSFELEWLSYSLKEKDIFDFTLLNPTQGLVKGEKLANFIKKNVGDRKIEDLRVPLIMTATDLSTGKLVLFDRGQVGPAVRASASIPVLFPPAQMGNRKLVDGGVINNIPADVARDRGADIIIVVDISQGVENHDLNNIRDYALQTITIMMASMAELRIKDADVVIRPDVAGVGIRDFSKKKELIQAGMEAAEEALPQIRELFKSWFTSHSR